MANRKFPIAWHEESLVNLGKSLEREREELSRKMASVSRLVDAWTVRSAQIEEAKRRGLAEFDPDRFLVSKKPKLQG